MKKPIHASIPHFLLLFIFLLAQLITHAQQTKPWLTFNVSGNADEDAVRYAFLGAYSRQLSEDYEVLYESSKATSVFTWDAASGPGCKDGFVFIVRVSEKEGDFPATSYKVFFLPGKGPRFEVWEPVDFSGPSESVDKSLEMRDLSPYGNCFFVSIQEKTSAPTGGLNNSEHLHLYSWSPKDHTLNLALNAHLVLDRMQEEGFSRELTISETKKPIRDVEVRGSEDGPVEVYVWRDGVYVRKQ